MKDEKLARLAQWSVGLEISGTAITTPEQAQDIHIKDSLVGADLEVLRSASRIIDIGAGAGFPGLVLAVALPQARVVLVDSVRKKMEAAGRIAAELELENVECVWGRAEEIAEDGGPYAGRFDVVTARALAQLNVLLEYAAPLLREGGSLVAWKGSPSQAELEAARGAAAQLSMSAGELLETKPFAKSQARHFYISKKLGPTPPEFPRRAGVALKRPLG